MAGCILKVFSSKVFRVSGRFFFYLALLSISTFGTLTPRLSHNGFVSASGIAPKGSFIATGWTMGFPIGGISRAASDAIEITAGFWSEMALASPPPSPNVTVPIIILSDQTGYYESIDFPLQISGQKPPLGHYNYNASVIAYTNGVELPFSSVNQLPDNPIWSLDLEIDEGDIVELSLASSNVFGFSSSRTILLITQIPEPVIFILLPFVLLFVFRKRSLNKKFIALLLFIIICVNAAQSYAAEFNYQGVVEIEGGAYSGDGYFKFAIGNEDETTNYWSNDGSSSGEPQAYIYINVTNGFFNASLGGSGMAPIPRTLFSDQSNLYLSVWFNFKDSGTFYKLGPAQKILPVPTALNSDLLDGHDYDNVIGNAYTNSLNSFLLKTGDVCSGELQVSNLVTESNIELPDDGRIYLNIDKSAYITSGASGQTTIFKNHKPVFEIE